MKNIFFRAILIFLIVIVCLSSFVYIYKKDVQKAKFNAFTEHIGEYKLDLKRTKLGSYDKDSIVYKNLTITFYSDSTFRLNMQVPFISGTSGRWLADAGDPESWNWLQFNKYLKKNKMDINIGNQFSHIENYEIGSGFYINGVRPMDNQDYIQEVFFIKQNKN